VRYHIGINALLLWQANSYKLCKPERRRELQRREASIATRIKLQESSCKNRASRIELQESSGKNRASRIKAGRCSGRQGRREKGRDTQEDIETLIQPKVR